MGNPLVTPSTLWATLLLRGVRAAAETGETEIISDRGNGVHRRFGW